MNILEIPGDLLLVRQDEAKKQTKGGVVLAEKYQRAPNTGTIMVVGDEVNVDRPDRPARRKYDSGERIMFTQFAGAPVVLDDIVHVILTPDEVLAVIDKDPETVPEHAVMETPAQATGDTTPKVKIATL